ncbi:MAG TPA: NAD(P)/FAD-dependent oxidoreductase [Streptosporangiaceae bacterium]|nr:NAD(P)/FAD-dependent oxidoreductase [Streptosporangiaceae bacterium]
MAERFDVIIIGMGPGGEACAGRLLAAGKRVAVIEKELIGGECAYWACIPSKTLLRPPEARAEATRAAGLATPALDWAGLRDYRDYMVRHLDDTAQVAGYEKAGATVIKGQARLAGPGRVEAAGRLLQADHVVIATGSQPVRPPVEGLDQVPVWTNREATSVRDIPSRVLLIGGSAVGVELGTFYARMGAAVTVIQRAGRLVDREDPRVGALAEQALAADGVTVRTGRTVARAGRAAGGAVVTLDDGSQVETDVVILAAGRRPSTGGLGLQAAGIAPDQRGAIPVDGQCRAGDGLWALGDVTGVALFTHVAMYQGRVVAGNILGRPRAASYHGIPRVVFGDPEIAAAGLTADQARAAGISLAAAEISLADAIARPYTYERDPRGALGLLADRDRRILVGAWAVAPLASEWIHTAALAIRAAIPLDVLLDQVAQFPTYSEAYLAALDQLGL